MSDYDREAECRRAMERLATLAPFTVEDGSEGNGEVWWIRSATGGYYDEPFVSRPSAQAALDAMTWAYREGWRQRSEDQRRNGLRANLLDNALDAADLQMGLCYDGPRIVERLTKHYGSLRKFAKQAGYSATYLSRIRSGQLVMAPKCYLRLCDLERDPVAPQRLTAKIRSMVADAAERENG